MHARSHVLDLVARLHLVPGHDLVAGELERGAQRGSRRSSAAAISARGTARSSSRTPSKRSVQSRTAASPRARTSAMIARRLPPMSPRPRRGRASATHVGRTAEIDTSQHGERLIVPAALSREPGIAPLRPGSAPANAACHAASVSSTSDLALLSSIGTQIEEIGARITEMAERYGATPDSALASELFAAERGLFGPLPRRFLDLADAKTSQSHGLSPGRD